MKIKFDTGSLPTVVVCCAGLLLVPACSLKHERHDEKELSYKAILDPWIGSGTREQLTQRFGPPLKTYPSGDSECWFWRFKYRKHVDDPFFPESGTFFDWDREELTAIFDAKGILKSWHVAVPVK